MKKILFFIPNLMHGGAEKVLVNLVNNLDKEKYDITLKTIFDEGINKKYLDKSIKYEYVFKKIFRGNKHIFKIFTPKFLYKHMIGNGYDIVVSYLEGPSARIISGCQEHNVKKICWIHTELSDEKVFCDGFRNISEAKDCYRKFDKIICVSNIVKQSICDQISLNENIDIIYNVNETDNIILKSKEEVNDIDLETDVINICSVGRIIDVKGYDRLARIHKRLIQEKIKNHIYIIGKGDKQNDIEKYLKQNNIENTFTFIGYKENPYKYVKNCDLFVCSSYREGLSTAVTESLIVGTPVLSTLCSGAKELLGYNNEYGIVVNNDEESLYMGLKELIQNDALIKKYKQKAKERSLFFSKEKIIGEIEEMIDRL